MSGNFLASRSQTRLATHGDALHYGTPCGTANSIRAILRRLLATIVNLNW
jgi:hypothetical protein